MTAFSLVRDQVFVAGEGYRMAVAVDGEPKDWLCEHFHATADEARACVVDGGCWHEGHHISVEILDACLRAKGVDRERALIRDD